MFDFLLRKWLEHEIDESNIDYAVSEGWITQDEGNTIKNTPREENE